jgi:hypothetical protein
MTIDERIKHSIERFNAIEPEVLAELARELDKLIALPGLLEGAGYESHLAWRRNLV